MTELSAASHWHALSELYTRTSLLECLDCYGHNWSIVSAQDTVYRMQPTVRTWINVCVESAKGVVLPLSCGRSSTNCSVQH
jgi:hypothetical protein